MTTAKCKSTKIVIAVMAILLVCMWLAVCAPRSYAAADTTTDAYALFATFAEDYSNRTVGTEYESAAAAWIARKLADMGYVAADGTGVVASMCRQFTFEYTETDDMYRSTTAKSSSYNVVAYKRSTVADAPLLVVAAPYGNEFSTMESGETLGFQDAAYSASSVAVLLSIAARLIVADLSFDVAFCAFGAEYYTFAGTAHFIEENTQSLLGAIYLSQIGVGDHLNVYYDEVSRTHQQFVDAFLSRFDYEVEHRPFNPGYSMQVYGGDLPYSHVGLVGGNSLFMAEDVPCMHLFGYNWASGTKGSESATHGDIVFTQDDTFHHFVELYGEEAISARLNTTAELVSRLILQDKDYAAALTAAKGDTTYHALYTDTAREAFRWTLLGVAVAAAVIVAVMLLLRAKRAGVPDFSVNSDFLNGEPPAAGTDTIFDEFGSVEGNPSDVDTTDDHSGDPPDSNDIFGEF